MTTDERLIIGLYNQEEQSLVDLYDRYSIAFVENFVPGCC